MVLSRHISLAAILSCLLVASAVSDEPKSSPLAEQIHAEARRILGRVQKSQYSHKTTVDEKEGVYFCDCSGFVDLVLKNVSPKHLAEIETHRAKGKRQLAEDYVEAFEQAPTTATGAWQRIARVADARPGDILCWKNLKHKAGDHANTGHVMIIDEPPVEESDRGQTLYRITVIDSTASPHADDTRKDNATGIGRGTLWLSVDSEGKPTGYHWKSPTGQFHETVVAIGRAGGQQ
jgi:hypothetical protein